LSVKSGTYLTFGMKSILITHLQPSEVNFTASRYKLRFSATLGEEPEIVLEWVIVPLCMENGLRFSARLDNGLPEVSFERVGR
jgi:hypothetical protein